MNGFRIIFSLRDSATQEYGILVHGVLCLFRRTKRRFSSIVMWSTLTKEIVVLRKKTITFFNVFLNLEIQDSNQKENNGQI